jgi:phosphohistidine phosphatase SixA
MKLLLMRHGLPDEGLDPGLSKTGSWLVRQRAQWCKKHAITVEQIRHSQWSRARETARIMAVYLKPRQGIVEVTGLISPGEISRSDFENEQADVLYVGHEPFLAGVSDLLLSGTPDNGSLVFKCATIVCLSMKNGTWSVEWVVT